MNRTRKNVGRKSHIVMFYALGIILGSCNTKQTEEPTTLMHKSEEKKIDQNGIAQSSLPKIKESKETQRVLPTPPPLPSIEYEVPPIIHEYPGGEDGILYKNENIASYYPEGEMVSEIIEIDVPQDEVLMFAEQNPEFPGGQSKLMEFLINNLNFPAYEKENGIQGKVYVRFVVNEDGGVSNPTILRSVSGSINFDKEVIRLINKMPNWNPGVNNGKKVKVYVTLPINFKLI